jgi:hypothetical protein
VVRTQEANAARRVVDDLDEAMEALRAIANRDPGREARARERLSDQGDGDGGERRGIPVLASDAADEREERGGAEEDLVAVERRHEEKPGPEGAGRAPAVEIA